MCLYINENAALYTPIAANGLTNDLESVMNSRRMCCSEEELCASILASGPMLKAFVLYPLK